MKNYKRLFVLIFTLVLTLMSGLCVSLYDNVKENTKMSENEVYWEVEDDLTFFMLAKAMEVNEDYEYFSFSENVPEEIENAVLNSMNSRIQDALYLFDNDSDILYSFTNTKTKQNVSRNFLRLDEVENSTYLHAKLTFDSRSLLKTNKQMYKDQFNKVDAKYLIQRIPYYIHDLGSSTVASCWDYVMSGDIKFTAPKNLEMVFVIPQELNNFSTLSYRINNWEKYMPYPALALSIGTILLAIFILIYPIRIVEETNPFLLVKKWKAGLNIAWLTCAITLMVMGCMVISSHTISGFFARLLQSYKIYNSNEILIASNFLIWFVTFYLIAIALFVLKYMFAHGFVRYLKEDTLVGTFLRWMKRLFHKTADIDLTEPVNRQVFKFVILHTVVILVITSFWGFGYILAIVYTFIMFFFLNDKLSKIKKDHEVMLEMTRELAQGNFESDVLEDLGIFNPLKEEFKNIKTGFEKAVQEETKSQNMKTELISHVSHDLKTPLTCIKNYIVLLEDETLTQAQRQEYLKNVNQYADRLNTLIEDLFEVSKVNSGNIQLELMDLNIVALIEQTKAEYQELLMESDLEVITNYEQPEMLVHLDGGKTYRIFENLFTNIGKYAMKHSRVYIDVKEINEDIVVEFKNISAVQMNFTSDEIVERFVRGDKSRHESGSGLGLAIVQSFTEIQGGTLQIDIDGDLFKTILTFKKAKPLVLESTESEETAE